ncbi:MAG: hypothetical protein IJW70_09000, partial [Clostridia bacterium]|nr:hypothetical protein [Clostridia bacterium]
RRVAKDRIKKRLLRRSAENQVLSPVPTEEGCCAQHTSSVGTGDRLTWDYFEFVAYQKIYCVGADIIRQHATDLWSAPPNGIPISLRAGG